MNIYVPRPGSPLARMILKGSGIVGTIQEDGKVLLDFEGNMYKSVNLTKWEDRVLSAWGRHVRRYPTVARTLADEKNLIQIGYLDEFNIIVLEDEASLNKWLN